jgi:hypothetical protein
VYLRLLRLRTDRGRGAYRGGCPETGQKMSPGKLSGTKHHLPMPIMFLGTLSSSTRVSRTTIFLLQTYAAML